MASPKTHSQFLDDIEIRNKATTNQIKLLPNQLYVNLDSKLWFECCSGHQNFITSPRYIIHKHSGCPLCGAKDAGLKNTLPLYDPSLTEYQNMQNAGFWRVWDCGTLKFTMFNIPPINTPSPINT